MRGKIELKKFLLLGINFPSTSQKKLEMFCNVFESSVLTWAKNKLAVHFILFGDD